MHHWPFGTKILYPERPWCYSAANPCLLPAVLWVPHSGNATWGGGST